MRSAADSAGLVLAHDSLIFLVARWPFHAMSLSFRIFSAREISLVPSLVGAAVPFPPSGNTRSELEKL